MLYHAQPGDIVVVDARGDLTSGVFGEMMMTYFRGRGGLGVVIDGASATSPRSRQLGLGLWLRGVTPNFHTQTNIYPFAVNVPIACGGVTVMPGDIIVADDDGAVVVPIALAPQLAQQGHRARRVGGVHPHQAVRGRRPAQVLPAHRRGAGRVRGLAQGAERAALLIVLRPVCWIAEGDGAAESDRGRSS